MFISWWCWLYCLHERMSLLARYTMKYSEQLGNWVSSLFSNRSIKQSSLYCTYNFSVTLRLFPLKNFEFLKLTVEEQMHKDCCSIFSRRAGPHPSQGIFLISLPSKHILGNTRTMIIDSIVCSPLFQTWKWKVLIAQLCQIICDPMDCSPPGSLVHGILQARILEWIALPFSKGSFWPRDQTQVSCIAGRFFTVWATREAQQGWLRQRQRRVERGVS